MLTKKESNFNKYIKIISVLVFFVLVFIFRTFFANFFVNTYARFFNKENSAPLTLSERDELNQLRVENKVLQDENQKLQDEFSVGIIDEKKSAVYMLMGNSTLYGDFYISLPKDKTPYVGMNVFSSGDIVVGQVGQILSNSLRVSRLGQTNSFIANSLGTDETVELQSLGAGLYVGTVSGGSKIAVGDTIVLKGYPKGIVGTVVEISKGNSSLSNIFVRTPYNINNKEILYVLD